MKPTVVLTCITVLFSTCLYAQKIEKYYDFRWKETKPEYAVYYSVRTKTDSGWEANDFFTREQKLQMHGLYAPDNDTIRNGNFAYYYPSGRLLSAGKYVNDKKTGLWLNFHDNGMVIDSAMYKDGHRTGVSMRWHANGYPKDSMFCYPDGNGIQLLWYDNGQPSGGGHIKNWGKTLTGKWVFFHKNGNKSAEENYNNNGDLTDAKYFDINGNPDPAADGKEHEAEFKGGQPAWKKYLEKNLYAPSQYKLANTDKAVVVLEFAIDEEGNVQDIKIVTSLHPAYDEIAVKVVKKSPKWNPAKEHNRNIKAYRRQPVTFAQD